MVFFSVLVNSYLSAKIVLFYLIYSYFHEKMYITKLKESEITEMIKKQILAVRDTGLTNMLDLNAVQKIANDENYYELVIFIEEHKKEYLNFIIGGK